MEAREIIDFIKECARNAGDAKGVVLGISGGIDSALVAVLAKEAMGSENVHLFYLPYGSTTFDMDKEHIEKFCDKFGFTYQTYDIKKIVDSFPKTSDYGLGNIKARVRMTYLYDFASESRCVVIGTTNHVEMKIGYFTKFGDGACDFEPIAHLFKSEIWDMSRELGIPDEIIDKPPSAGLWDGQTDEDEIGVTYDKMDKIIKYMYTHEGEEEFDPQDFNKIHNLIRMNNHKNQLPLRIHRDFSEE